MNSKNDQRIWRKLADLTVQMRSECVSASVDPDPEEYAGQFGIVGRGCYGKLNPELIESEASIHSANDDFVPCYNKLLALSLLSEFNPLAGECRLPQSILELYRRDLSRIESQLDEKPNDFYRLSNDAFVKDLAILSHKLIPVGAEYVTPDSGVARSLIFRGGIVQLFEGVRACLFECGGFAPFFELHAHVLALDDFNPIGWQETYIRLAELLELNPRYRGITSSSWFLDPALEQISPRLSYLRRIPEEGGATILFSSYDITGESGALEKSATRRRLYQFGQYVPATYTRIWPRKKLINWKDQFKGSHLL